MFICNVRSGRLTFKAAATDSETVRPSEEKFSDGYFLSTADRQGFSKCYTEGSGYTGMHPHVSPLRSDDLNGLPAALVVTAGFDILRDEGDAYAEALKAAGTRTEHLRIPSLGHGFLHMTTITPAASAAMVRIARDWRALLDDVRG